jgi:hypothetical protein
MEEFNGNVCFLGLCPGFPNYGYFPAAPAVPTATTNAADRANIAAAATGYYDYAAAQVIIHLLLLQQKLKTRTVSRFTLILSISTYTSFKT